MAESNDVTQKSVMGIVVILIALALLIAFVVFLVLNLRHWKTQTYKIRVVQRRAALRGKRKRKKLSESQNEAEINTTEFKMFVLNELIKIVVRMNSLKFWAVFWITADKYYHIAIWVFLELKNLWGKCRKKQVTVKDSKDDEHMKNFNLLKPLSRFYHFINLSGIVTMWLIVNCMIAVLVKLEKANESISAATFIAGVLISTVIGHFLIMLITKLLHVLYMKNIEDSFAQKEKDMKVNKALFGITPKPEAHMISNEYNLETDKFESKQTKEKWEISSITSSQRPDTARGLAISTSRQSNRSLRGAAVVPISNPEESKPLRPEYRGDVDLIEDESTKSNNLLNITIFLVVLGFFAFFSLFSCIYAYVQYSQTVILFSILMMIVAALIEVLVLRPLSCLLITCFTMCKRKVKSKEIMMREIEEVKDELNLNSSYFKEKSEDSQEEHKLSEKPDKDQHQDEAFKDNFGGDTNRLSEQDLEEGKHNSELADNHFLKDKQDLHQDKLKDKLRDKHVPKPERPKPESMSEAAKIARYNIKLLESIYEAYEPEQADHVVKIFRKGGLFSVVPIMEEDLEDSFESSNNDLESNGTADANLAVFAAPDDDKRNKDGRDQLGDIKEENSQLLEDLQDDNFKHDDHRSSPFKGKNDKNGNLKDFNLDDDNLQTLNLQNDIKNKNSKRSPKKDKAGSNSDMTGFDFEDSKKNSMHKQPILIDNFEDYMFDADDLGKHRDFGRGDSSSFDEETPLGGITMNERKKRKKRRKQKKKKDPYNPKIRQLEEIYDNKNLRNTSVKGDTSQFGGEFTSKNTLRSRKNITSLVCEKTVKLSDSISPRGNIELNSPILSPNTNKMANTNDNWMGGNKKKMNIKTQNTLKSEQNKIKSKKKSDKGLNFYDKSAMAASPNLGVSPNLTKSTDTLFKDKKTNADAHRGELIKKNNFLRASLNAGGKLQMNSNASANSSNGFKNAKKSPKKSNDRGRSMNRNDLVLNTTALKEEFGKSKKKLPRRRFSKSPAVFKIDGESPYAEYLPALYREYRPKEKKLKRQNSNVSLNDFFKKLDRAYSDVGSVGIRSRDGSRDGKSLRRKGSNNKSLLKMNTFKSDSSVSSYHKQKSIRSNSSKVTKNKKKTSSVNDDSFLKLAELVKARVTKAKNQ